MSSIPSSAMPHAYVHEDEDPDTADRAQWPANGILIGGAAVVAYFLYRIFR